MSRPPYQVDEEDHTTLALMDPPGPPEYPAPPGSGEPGRPVEGDRIWIHLAWELLLAVGVLTTFLAVRNSDADALRGDGLDNFLIQVASLGLIASGLSFSLRAAVPNLAVGAIASGSGAVLGFALALVVVAFHVPAWATTLGTAVLLGGVTAGVVGTNRVALDGDQPDVVANAWIWAALFAVVSIIGGAAWVAPGLRRGLGSGRQDRDAARRPPAGAVFGGLIALVVSSTLASGGGVLSVLRLGGAAPRALDNLTWVAFGAVLVGGVSVFGRRAGIFGTLLGVLLLSLIQLWLVVESVDTWVFTTITGGAIVAGLIVSRLLEAAGRKPAREPPSPQYY
jgi:ribose/xylose/arabinose/galactoside ABC-type transport system permease subunit